MAKFLFAALLVTSFLIQGCDPMRRIDMKNESGEKAEIIWTIKEDSIHASPLYMSNSKESSFELKPKGKGHRIYLSAGIGYWNINDIHDLADDLESLVIRWGTQEIKLETEEAIVGYLLPRRGGLDRAKLRIIVKKSE